MAIPTLGRPPLLLLCGAGEGAGEGEGEGEEGGFAAVEVGAAATAGEEGAAEGRGLQRLELFARLWRAIVSWCA